MFCNLHNTNLQNMPRKKTKETKKFMSLQFSRKNPSKQIQIIIKLINCDFGWVVLFCIICRTQICRLYLKTQFSAIFLNNSMLESEQQVKKIDLEYFVINHQWFRVAYIVLCNLRNTNSQILPTKKPPGNRITDY